MCQEKIDELQKERISVLGEIGGLEYKISELKERKELKLRRLKHIDIEIKYWKE